MYKNLLCTAAAVLACGCSGGGGDGDASGGSDGVSAICQVVGTGNVSSTGTATNITQAFDADLLSFALVAPGSSAAATFTGRGIDRMAGEVPGVAFTRPTGGSVSVTITTYKDGAPADSRQAATATFTMSGQVQTCSGMNCDIRNGVVFWGIDTTNDFDEIEAAISITNLPAPLELRELCVN
jgi:hypothetical protein